MILTTRDIQEIGTKIIVLLREEITRRVPTATEAQDAEAVWAVLSSVTESCAQADPRMQEDLL